MFGLGFSEILLILAVALIFVGPDKLPELAQKLGRLVWQVRHSAEELRKEISLPSSEEMKSMQKEIAALRKFDQTLKSPGKALINNLIEPGLLDVSPDSCDENKTCEDQEKLSQSPETSDNKSNTE